MFLQFCKIDEDPSNQDNVIISGNCRVTGEEYVLPSVPVTAIEDYIIYGRFVQDAFPMLTKEQREFLVSGTSPKGWEIIFPQENAYEE